MYIDISSKLYLFMAPINNPKKKIDTSWFQV